MTTTTPAVRYASPVDTEAHGEYAIRRDEATEPGFDGHISVPTLWDRQTGQVVSNDFVTLGLDLATEFDAWKEPLLAGFSRLDDYLADREFLVGGRLTEADIRLFVTLIRYDQRPALSTNPELSVYPRLAAYASRLYALPAFQRTTDFASFGSSGELPSFLITAEVADHA